MEHVVAARDTFETSISNEMSCVEKTETSLQDTTRTLTQRVDEIVKETSSFSSQLCDDTTSDLENRVLALENQGDAMLNAMSNVRDETTSSGASLMKRVKDHVENASKRVDISGRTPCKTELSRQCVGQVSKIVSPLPTQSLRVLHRVGRDMLRMGGKAPTVSTEKASTEKTTTQKTTTSKKKRKSDASNTKSTKKRKSDPVVSVLSENKNNVAPPPPPRSTRKKKRRATVHTPQDIKKHAAAVSSKKKRRASSIPLPTDENSTKKWNTPKRRGSSKLRRPSRRSLQ